MKPKLIAAFIALALCVAWFYHVREYAFGIPNNATNFWLFDSMSHAAYHADNLGAWRGRIGGLLISGALFDTTVHAGALDQLAYRNVFGFYHAAWLGILFAIIIAFVKNPIQAIFVLLGMFAAVTYTLTPSPACYAYPYDMPAVVFFTLAYFLWRDDHPQLLFLTICVGYVFKETIIVTAALFFFFGLPWKKWLLHFLGVLVATWLIKITIMGAIYGQPVFFTQDFTRSEGGSSFTANLHYLFTPQWNHAIFCAGGMLALTLLLPTKLEQSLVIKVLVLLFMGGQLICGGLQEYRSLLDVAPLCLIYVFDALEDMLDEAGRKVKIGKTLTPENL